MFVVEVIPLVRGTKINTLSYFSSQDLVVGTFVSVPIRSKNYRAIVVAAKPVSQQKTQLKTADFSLRKLPPQENLSVIPKTIRQTAEELTKTYPISAGAILYQMLPPDIKNGSYQFSDTSPLIHEEDPTPQILTATRAERYVAYRSFVRGILARRGSVIFVVPTIADLALAQKELSVGIENRIVTFSPYQTKNERQQAFTAFEDTTIAKIIITTPAFAYLERVDLLAIVLERGGSNLFRERVRPYLHHLTALTVHAKTTGRQLLIGDILPRTEEEAKRRQDFYQTHGEEAKRLVFPSAFTVVEQKAKPIPENSYSLFSTKLKNRIKNTIDGRGRVFLFGARRGLAPAVVCIDCGFIFRCPDSHTPYSLLRTKNKAGEEERWFISSVSGSRVRAADVCSQCGSWRLRQLGLGIQQVYDDCVATFPDQDVILFDSQTAPNKKKAQDLIKNFYTKRGQILVGTQMTLPYLAEKGVELSAVISLDATRSSPTWRADEDTFRTLLEIRDFTHKEVVVQTKAEPDELLSNVARGFVDKFYSDQISLRESFNYPPFATFILLSWLGNKKQIDEVEAGVKHLTQKYHGSFYSNPASTAQKTLRYALFRLPPRSPELAQFIILLRELPPYIKIEINPDRIV